MLEFFYAEVKRVLDKFKLTADDKWIQLLQQLKEILENSRMPKRKEKKTWQKESEGLDQRIHFRDHLSPECNCHRTPNCGEHHLTPD